MIEGHRRRLLLLIVAILVLPLLWATSASAISLVKVREIYPGSNNDSFVELQAFGSFLYSGETMPGKAVILFDPTGHPTVRFTFTEKNDQGADDTSFLVGDTKVEETFGVEPDVVDPLMEIDPAGGAVCWNVEDFPVDCAAWGDFTGQAAIEAYAGTGVGNPASPGGITPGKSLERLITPNCPTWLEGEDDTDDSATDFVEANPTPFRTGMFDPAVVPCESGMPEDTAILAKPPSHSPSSDAHFTYSAPTATSFQCRLDGEPRFTTCPNGGKDYTSLGDGSHTLLVRGLNASGPDKVPASYTWSVDTVAPTATILGHPGATSYGKTAAFTFTSDDQEATFGCSLDSAPASSCASGIVLHSLSSGTHTFEVAATDAAGNVQPVPASYTWTVDSTPPSTTIDSRPADPTTSSSVSFTYHASRPDTFFECSMDGTPFSSCPSSGATYPGLAIGGHTFRVRAIDSDGEVEANPPAFSFAVVTAPPPVTCRKGFRKKRVGGVVRCVKKPRRHHHRHRS